MEQNKNYLKEWREISNRLADVARQAKRWEDRIAARPRLVLTPIETATVLRIVK
jgi:hypothetical protein